jgi:hypothetical protein
VSTAEKYVTAAYLVVLGVVLLYVVIYAFKLQRLSRDVARLREAQEERVERRSAEEPREEPELAEPARR